MKISTRLLVAAMFTAGLLPVEASPVATRQPGNTAPPSQASAAAATHALPPHMRLMDADLVRALCVAPDLANRLNCFESESATAVLRSAHDGKRHPWAALICRVDSQASAKRNVEIIRQRLRSNTPWTQPTSLCHHLQDVLVTIIIESATTPGDAHVLSGTKGSLAGDMRVRRGAGTHAPLHAGVRHLESLAGGILNILFIRSPGERTSTTGLDNRWGFAGKEVSE